MRRIDSLFQIVTRRTDARPVAIVRLLVGLAAIGFALESWVNMGRVLLPQVVDMPYVAWYPRVSVATLPLFIGLWLCAALAFALGLGTRLCGAILTLSMAYTFTGDGLYEYLLAKCQSSTDCAIVSREQGYFQTPNGVLELSPQTASDDGPRSWPYEVGYLDSEVTISLELHLLNPDGSVQIFYGSP